MTERGLLKNYLPWWRLEQFSATSRVVSVSNPVGLNYSFIAENMKKQLLKVEIKQFDQISNWIKLVTSLLSKDTTEKVVGQQMKLLSKVLADGKGKC